MLHGTWLNEGERAGEGVLGRGNAVSKDPEVHGTRFCLTRAEGSINCTQAWRVWSQFVESWRKPGRLLLGGWTLWEAWVQLKSFPNSVIY